MRLRYGIKYVLLLLGQGLEAAGCRQPVLTILARDKIKYHVYTTVFLKYLCKHIMKKLRHSSEFLIVTEKGNTCLYQTKIDLCLVELK